jgi:hypothetical protein
MSVQISTQIIHKSFAAVINEVQANANIYDNPNQQGTVYPAWFIVHRSPVEIRRDTGKRLDGNRYELTYQIDLWYMLQQNITGLFDQYTQIAEALDSKLEYLPIFGSDAVVHVYDRSWSLELNALKYSTTLRLRVFTDTNFVFEPMEVIEDVNTFIKNANMVTMSFTNEEHPEFEVELPLPIAAEIGDYVRLPFVSAHHHEEEQTWIAYKWDIGDFGKAIQMNENMTANLLWKVAEIVSLSFANTEHPEFEIELPDPVVLEKGGSYVLPELSGEYEKEGKTYEPDSWTIGGFGESISVTEDTITDLIWKEITPVGPVYPEGQFVSGVLNSNPERFIGNTTAILFEAINTTDQMQVTGWTTFNESVPMNGVDQSVIPMLNGFMTRG